MRRCWGCAIESWNWEQASIQIDHVAVGGTVDRLGENPHGNELAYMPDACPATIASLVGHERIRDMPVTLSVHSVADFLSAEFQVGFELWCVPDGSNDIASHGV